VKHLRQSCLQTGLQWAHFKGPRTPSTDPPGSDTKHVTPLLCDPTASTTKRQRRPEVKPATEPDHYTTTGNDFGYRDRAPIRAAALWQRRQRNRPLLCVHSQRTAKRQDAGGNLDQSCLQWAMGVQDGRPPRCDPLAACRPLCVPQ
jgi:hypothetical protein